MSKDLLHDLLFSVTIKDCEVQTFSSSGAGGQHRDHGKVFVNNDSFVQGIVHQYVKERKFT